MFAIRVAHPVLTLANFAASELIFRNITPNNGAQAPGSTTVQKVQGLGQFLPEVLDLVFRHSEVSRESLRGRRAVHSSCIPRQLAQYSRSLQRAGLCLF